MRPMRYLGLKNSIKSITERFGFTITRAEGTTLRQHLRFVLKKLSVDCALDVGAHTGGFYELLRETGYEGPVVSFEPSASTFAILKETTAHDRAWTGFNIALGAAN